MHNLIHELETFKGVYDEEFLNRVQCCIKRYPTQINENKQIACLVLLEQGVQSEKTINKIKYRLRKHIFGLNNLFPFRLDKNVIKRHPKRQASILIDDAKIKEEINISEELEDMKVTAFQKELIIARLKGFTLNEIAEGLNIPVNQLKYEFVKIRKKWKESQRKWKDENQNT